MIKNSHILNLPAGLGTGATFGNCFLFLMSGLCLFVQTLWQGIELPMYSVLSISELGVFQQTSSKEQTKNQDTYGMPSECQTIC